MPGLLKIGLTKHTPQKRAAELYSTGVPVQFELEKCWRVPHAELKRAERDIHEILSDYRINNKREFFLVERELALRSVGQYIKDRGFTNTEVSSEPGLLDKIAIVSILLVAVIATYLVSLP